MCVYVGADCPRPDRKIVCLHSTQMLPDLSQKNSKTGKRAQCQDKLPPDRTVQKKNPFVVVVKLKVVTGSEPTSASLQCFRLTC